jgi:hypothetical protein
VSGGLNAGNPFLLLLWRLYPYAYVVRVKWTDLIMGIYDRVEETRIDVK